jgi:hypothetical protein
MRTLRILPTDKEPMLPMIEASTQREDEANYQPTTPINGATPSDAPLALQDGQEAADHSQIVTPPTTPAADNQAAISVPVPTEPTLTDPIEMSEPVIPAAPAVELFPLLPDDTENTRLPVRPVVTSLPAGNKAATTEAASLPADGVLEVGGEAQPLTRRGRIELLPNEEIIYHLGALYLTNKRVLLYAPTVLRAAFLRDVDGMGMATERLSGGVFILGLVMMVLAGLTGLLIFFDARQELAADSPLKSALLNVRDFLPVPLEWLAIAVAALGLFFIVSYFLYVSKSLFVSVHGRPLITISISGYRPRNLDDVDNFINALAAAKDAITSDE